LEARRHTLEILGVCRHSDRGWLASMSPVLGVKEQGQGRVRGGGVPDAVHSAVPSASRRHWSSRGSRDERASARAAGGVAFDCPRRAQ
jgi:hypothetical protein